jgi:hypothetical protein
MSAWFRTCFVARKNPDGTTLNAPEDFARAVPFILAQAAGRYETRRSVSNNCSRAF